MIYFAWFSIRIMQASVWLHCSFVTLLNFLKSPQKFVLCYLSVACSQFLACFHCSVFKVQIRCPAPLSLPRFPSDSLSGFHRSVLLWFSIPFGLVNAFSVLFQDQIETLLSNRFDLNLKFSGGPKWTRTTDLTIISRAL